MKSTLLFLCIFVPQTSFASLIEDFITVDGLDWAQPVLFVGNTWNDIDSVCPSGICAAAGEINGHDMTGWLWATRDQILPLFQSLMPGLPSSFINFSEVNSIWGPEVFDSLGFTPTSTSNTGGNVARRLFGWSSEKISYSPSNAWMPVITDYSLSTWSDTSSLLSNRSLTQASSTNGAYFFRTTQSLSVRVSEPTHLYLIFIVFLIWSRRSKLVKPNFVV
jgi:hypothetical protein